MLEAPHGRQGSGAGGGRVDLLRGRLRAVQAVEDVADSQPQQQDALDADVLDAPPLPPLRERASLRLWGRVSRRGQVSGAGSVDAGAGRWAQAGLPASVLCNSRGG